MKNLLFLTAFILIFSSCSKDKNNFEESDTSINDNAVYNLVDIQFYLDKDDGITSKNNYAIIDTGYIFNGTEKKTYYPFKGIKDTSIFILKDEFIKYQKNLADTLVSPPSSITSSNNISYWSKPRFFKFPGTDAMEAIIADEHASIEAGPNTMHTINSDYSILWMKTSFKATYREKTTGEYLTIEGDWYGSSASREGGSVVNTGI